MYTLMAAAIRVLPTSSADAPKLVNPLTGRRTLASDLGRWARSSSDIFNPNAARNEVAAGEGSASDEPDAAGEERAKRASFEAAIEEDTVSDEQPPPTPEDPPAVETPGDSDAPDDPAAVDPCGIEHGDRGREPGRG